MEGPSHASACKRSRDRVVRWAGCGPLCLALDAPDRIAALASLGVPAVALPGVHGDPFFTALSTPGLRQLAARIRSPNVATTRRSLARGVAGPRAAERAPDGFFEVVHEGMRQPGFRTALLSHMRLAMRLGRPRAENVRSDPAHRSPLLGTTSRASTKFASSYRDPADAGVSPVLGGAHVFAKTAPRC